MAENDCLFCVTIPKPIRWLVDFGAKFTCGILGGNQFACGQVSRSINVTDKPQERGRSRGVGLGGRGLGGLERRTQCTVIHVKGKACSTHCNENPIFVSFSGNCAASVAISDSCVC